MSIKKPVKNHTKGGFVKKNKGGKEGLNPFTKATQGHQKGRGKGVNGERKKHHRRSKGKGNQKRPNDIAYNNIKEGYLEREQKKS